MTEPLAYTVNDFLKLAGIGRTRFYEAINSGQLKARKNGSKTLILAADARAYLDGLPQLQPKQTAA